MAAVLEGKRICVCVGAGGVGKTTTSAAIAVGFAARGLKVVVVTIDPARRLADALGVEQLGNDPRRVEPSRLGGLAANGELWAVMLDPKRTFDDLIDRIAPTPQRAAEIKGNKIYREISSAISGSQEFTAIEKLYELTESDYDLIVLDTPPAHSAAEFLNAPGRLTAFFGGSVIQTLLRPTGFGMRLLGRGVAPVLGALKLVTGADLVSDLVTFFTLLGGMAEEFNARAVRVAELLRAPETAFVIVTSAQDAAIGEAIRFNTTLRDAQMPVLGAIVNRVNQPLPPGEAPLGLPPDLTARVAACAADHSVLAERDAANIARLRAELNAEPILPVPDFGNDIHDVEGLLAIHRELFDE